MGLGTAWGILCTFIAREFHRDAEKYKTRAADWQERWEHHRCNPQDGLALIEMQQAAMAWRDRYNLQVQRCAVEHVERAWPILPLGEIEAQELEAELPF